MTRHLDHQASELRGGGGKRKGGRSLAGSARLFARRAAALELLRAVFAAHGGRRAAGDDCLHLFDAADFRSDDDDGSGGAAAEDEFGVDPALAAACDAAVLAALDARRALAEFSRDGLVAVGATGFGVDAGATLVVPGTDVRWGAPVARVARLCYEVGARELRRGAYGIASSTTTSHLGF